MFLMWPGERIDKYGICKGVSLILTVGSIARMPAASQWLAENFQPSPQSQEADIGIAGKDVMLELDRAVHELLDLGISRCYIATAGLPNTEMNEVTPRIATKYPKIASRFYRSKGEQVEIIELNGSIELAPMIGLADRIVDIVSTGKTLKENGLVEYEEIVEITSRLIANPVSYRLKQERIRGLVENLRKQVER